MPQLAKGGKFVFGWSIINDDYSVQLPEMAIEEYNITSEKRVYIISGSKQTGGFCISKKELLLNSKMGNILNDNLLLKEYKTTEGEFIKYKGRLYCWLYVNDKGKLQFTESVLDALSLKMGDKLLSIRGSDVAFVMGVKGRLIEHANDYQGEISTY